MSDYLDTETVRAKLTPLAIAEWYSWHVRRSGTWLRARICPACGGGDSDAFSIGDHGFKCHRCDVHGDLFTLIALFEGMQPKCDFPRILDIAGVITGVAPGECVRGAVSRAEAMRAFRDTERRKDVARYEWAAVEATRTWNALPATNCAGEKYLHQRGLKTLIGRSDVVKYDGLGTIRLPLYDWEGRIVNVPGRYLPGSHRAGRRILNVTGCPTKGSFGRTDLLRTTAGPVVLCEGIFDYLSAEVIWPDRSVLGAHGAGNISHIARRIGQSLAQTSRTLFIIPHGDGAGRNATRKARQAAIDVGMRAECIRFYDVTQAGDLNDWWLRQSPP